MSAGESHAEIFKIHTKGKEKSLNSTFGDCWDCSARSLRLFLHYYGLTTVQNLERRTWEAGGAYIQSQGTEAVTQKKTIVLGVSRECHGFSMDYE